MEVEKSSVKHETKGLTCTLRPRLQVDLMSFSHGQVRTLGKENTCACFVLVGIMCGSREGVHGVRIPPEKSKRYRVF